MCSDGWLPSHQVIREWLAFAPQQSKDIPSETNKLCLFALKIRAE